MLGDCWGYLDEAARWVEPCTGRLVGLLGDLGSSSRRGVGSRLQVMSRPRYADAAAVGSFELSRVVAGWLLVGRVDRSPSDLPSSAIRRCGASRGTSYCGQPAGRED
jgi:hypothetical protein